MKRTIILLVVFFLAISLKNCVDPCELMDCANGGICDKGECLCPDGYTGTYCTEEVQPDVVKITKFEVLDFPTINSSKLWDDEYGYSDTRRFPDLYIVLREQVNEDDWVDVITTNVIEDASYLESHVFTLSSPVTITADGWFNIRLYDRDPDETYDDFIAVLGMRPYEYGEGLPLVKEFDDSETVTEIAVSFSYEWK